MAPNSASRALPVVMLAACLAGTGPAPALQKGPDPATNRPAESHYRADMRRAAQLAEAEKIPELLDLLQEHQPVDKSADVRGWEWYYLRALALRRQEAEQQLFAVQGHADRVTGFAWSPDGKKLASRGGRGPIKVWDVASGKELFAIGDESTPHFFSTGPVVNWSPTGQQLATVARRRVPGKGETWTSGELLILDAATGKELCRIESKDNERIRQFEWSPDGRRVAATSWQAAVPPGMPPQGRSSVTVFDATTGKRVFDLEGQAGAITAVAWSRDGRRLASGSQDGLIINWDASTGKEIAALTEKSTSAVIALAWGPDGKQLVSVSRESTQMWDVAQRKELWKLRWYADDSARASWSSDGERLLLDSSSGLKVLQPLTSQQYVSLGPEANRRWARDLEVRRLALAGYREVRIVNLPEGEETSVVHPRLSGEANVTLTAFSLSPDGKYLAMGGGKGTIEVVPVVRSRSIGLRGTPNDLTWSPSGDRFTLVYTRGQYYSGDGHLHLGRLPLDSPLQLLGSSDPPPRVHNAALSPTGQLLAVTYDEQGRPPHDGVIELIATATGKSHRRLPGHGKPVTDPGGYGRERLPALIWGPAGKNLLSYRSMDRTLKVWDAVSGKELFSLRLGASAPSTFYEPPRISFSDDDQKLAVGDVEGGGVEIWEVTSRKIVQRCSQGRTYQTPLALSPDAGQLAIFGGNPNQLQVWDLKTGQLTATIEDRIRQPAALAWSPDGKALAWVGSAGGTVRHLPRKQTVALELDPREGNFTQVLWNSASDQVALTRGQQFQVYEATTGKRVTLANTWSGSPAWTPKGLVAIRGIDSTMSGLPELRDQATNKSLAGWKLELIDATTGKTLTTIRRAAEELEWVVRGGRATVAWRPDGRQVATIGFLTNTFDFRSHGSSRNEPAAIRIWDSASGQLVTTLNSPRRNLSWSAVAWSPDGSRLAAVGPELHIWNLATGALEKEWKRTGPQSYPVWLAWHPKGRYLAIFDRPSAPDATGVISLWDVAAGKVERTLSIPLARWSSATPAPLAWSPDGQQLAAVGKNVKVWEAATGKDLLTLVGHEGQIQEVYYSPDGRRLISRSAQQASSLTTKSELKVWDAASGDELISLGGEPATLHFNPTLHVLVAPAIGSGRQERPMTLWDVTPSAAPSRPRAQTRPAKPPPEEATTKTGLSEAENQYRVAIRRAATFAQAGEWQPMQALLDAHQPTAGAADARAWEWAFLQALLQRREASSSRMLGKTQGGTFRLHWSPDGRKLAARSQGGAVRVWDTATATELFKIGEDNSRGPSPAVVWSPTGKNLIAINNDGSVRLFDSANGKLLASIPGAANKLRRVSWSADGQRFAITGAQNAVPVFEAEMGREVLRCEGHGGEILAVAWSPTGSQLASAARDGTLKVWDGATGKEAYTVSTNAGLIGEIAWRPDAQRLATISSSPVLTQVWNLRERKEEWALAFAPEQIPLAQWSRDGQRLALGTPDSLNRIVDAASGRSLFTNDPNSRGRADPDLKRVALHQGLEVIILDSLSGTKLHSLIAEPRSQTESSRQLDESISQVGWHPDGSALAVGNFSGQVQVLKAAPSNMVLFRGPSAFSWDARGEQFVAMAQSRGAPRIGRLPLTTPLVTLGEASQATAQRASLSPDGKRLALAYLDGAIEIFSRSGGKGVLRLPGHTKFSTQSSSVDRTPHMLWSKRGKRLATLRGSDGTLKVWDTETGRELAYFDFGPSNVWSSEVPPLAWAADEKQLAWYRDNWKEKLIHILDVETGQRRQLLQLDAPLKGPLAWHPDGQQLAFALDYPKAGLHIWDVSAGKARSTVLERESGVTALSWSPDGQALVWLTGSAGGGIKHLKTNKTMSLDLGSRGNTGWGPVWSPDGSQFAFHGGFHAAFEVASGARLRLEEPPPAKPGELPRRLRIPQSMAWTSEGRLAAGQGYRGPPGSFEVQNMATGDILFTTAAQVVRHEWWTTHDRPAIAWRPDGKQVATLGAVTHGHLRHSDVGIWDAASGALQRSLRLSYGGSGHALAWSPDGLRLAATLGAQFEIWNAATGQKETDGTRSIGDRAGPEWLGWSSDGRFLAFVDRPRFESSATVTLWDVVAGKQTHSFPAVFQPGLLMSPAAWSPDGKRLAVVGKEITVWNADTGKEQFRLVGHDGRVVEVAWSPDGRRLISRSERANVRDNAYELRVWDMSRGDEIMVLRGESAGYVFSPQLQMLVVPVANDRESSSVLWDVRMPAKGSAGPNRRE